MLIVELVVLAGVAVAVGLLALVSRFGGRDDGPDQDIEFATWRRVDAEVISTLRACNRTFLRVRFSVGTSLIQNDVQYPLPGAVPHAGQRVLIRYDPAAPARMVFDLHRPAAHH
jgi:hypothetical protein